MNTRNVIIMGGTGFIGSWLVRDLLQQHYSVAILVRTLPAPEEQKNLWGGVTEDKRNLTIYRREDIEKLKASRAEWDAFYFLAWDGVTPEHKNDADLQISNITYALEAMRLAKKLNCQKFIAAGTVAEYVFCENIIDINEKPAPSDFYGAAKVSVHYMLDVLSKQILMDFIWAVLPSTFGPGRKGNNIITYTISTLLKGETPRYGDLEQLWDFLYVTEVAKALRLIGEKGTAGKTYGIGSGNYRKLKDYMEEIRDCINPEQKLDIGALPEMSRRTFSSCVNIFDLINDTGFQVQVSFQEGIRRTVDSMKRTGSSDYNRKGCGYENK